MDWAKRSIGYGGKGARCGDAAVAACGRSDAFRRSMRYIYEVFRGKSSPVRLSMSHHHRAWFFMALLATLTSHANAQWINYPVPGIPRLADGKVNLAAPAPKTPEGKPDLSGVWAGQPDYFRDLAKDLKPEDVEMLPSAKTLQEQREKNDHREDPLAKCLPPGVPASILPITARLCTLSRLFKHHSWWCCCTRP